VPSCDSVTILINSILKSTMFGSLKTVRVQGCNLKSSLIYERPLRDAIIRSNLAAALAVGALPNLVHSRPRPSGQTLRTAASKWVHRTGPQGRVIWRFLSQPDARVVAVCELPNALKRRTQVNGHYKDNTVNLVDYAIAGPFGFDAV